MKHQIKTIQVQGMMAFALALAGMGIVAGAVAIIIVRRRRLKGREWVCYSSSKLSRPYLLKWSSL